MMGNSSNVVGTDLPHPVVIAQMTNTIITPNNRVITPVAVVVTRARNLPDRECTPNPVVHTRTHRIKEETCRQVSEEELYFVSWGAFQY